MVEPLVVINVGLILTILASVAGYAYLDAPEYGMNPVKWAAISFFVPIFGFFAYLFERDERRPDPENDPEDQFVGGAFKIHKSRAGDAPWIDSDEAVENRDEESEE